MVLGSALLAVAASAAEPPRAAHDAAKIERGRYLTMIGGCNDCHTPNFALAGGKIPQSQWLTGDSLGWQGAWGTTYPPNLRLRIGTMDLATWKTFARNLTTRPPMPYWAVNSMSDADLERKFHGLVDPILGMGRAAELHAALGSVAAITDISALTALTRPA